MKKQLSIRIPHNRGTELVIILLFSILPLVDMLNGLFTKLPIGIAYKVGICVALFFITVQKGKLIKKYMLFMLGIISYMLISITINVLMGGKLITIEYPIKLVFNVVLLCLLIMCLKKGVLSGQSLYTIFDNSTWIFIFCYLVPYVLGVGNTVYVGEMGYKAFYISQNELSLVVTTMAFYISYKLINKIRAIDVVKMALIVLIGMLLNTKAAIIACILAVILWLLTIVLNGSFRVKLAGVFVVVVGFSILGDRIVSAITNSMFRYSILTSRYYGGSQLAGVLSGRNYSVEDALREFKSGNQVIRFLFGNGFCSNTLTEMDLLDIFFYLGIFGLTATIIFLIRVLRILFKKRKMDNSLFGFLSFSAIVMMLTLSGHVLFMSMSGCYFVLYVCFLLYYQKYGNVKNRSMVIDQSSAKFHTQNTMRK